MPILGIIASSRLGNLVTTSYESIATVTVGGGGSASASFTSIPATYTHLQLSWIGKVQANTGRCVYENLIIIQVQIIARHSLRGNGSAASA
jgi:hypothetical protein